MKNVIVSFVSTLLLIFGIV